jgi:hypothetical protein
VPGGGVGGERQRHRGARRRLADDERPAGGDAPPGAEAAAGVDVRAPRLRVERREAGGRRRVAERDDGRQREAREQARAGRAGGRGEGGEDTGAHHGAEAEDDGVADPQPAGEPLVGRHRGIIPRHPAGRAGRSAARA